MMPKILFTDIDGTLLNKDRELSLRTLKEIQRINLDFSIPIVLVSARMPKSMRLLQSQLKIKNEIICYNGSLILGHNDAEIIGDERINNTISESIIGKATENDIHISLFVNDFWIANKNDFWAERETRNTKVSPENITESKIKD